MLCLALSALTYRVIERPFLLGKARIDREQRAKEREERQAKLVTDPESEIPVTVAEVQKTQLEKMLEQLNRIHKRT